MLHNDAANFDQNGGIYSELEYQEYFLVKNVSGISIILFRSFLLLFIFFFSIRKEFVARSDETRNSSTNGLTQ